MNRQEIEPLLPELNIFLNTLRRFSQLLILITFAGYGSAFWFWSEGQTLGAILAASVSFILFYTTKRQLVNITSHYLKQDPHYHTMLYFIQRNLAQKSAPHFMTQLQKALAVIQKNSD